MIVGTTYIGGTNGTGRVFEITPDGSESILYNFGPTSGTDGQNPNANVVLGGAGDFYGTTTYGGTNGTGTVFKITPDGNETVVYSFAPTSGTGGQNQGWLRGIDISHGK